MKPDYKDDRSETMVAWAAYLVIMMLVLAIAWVAWSNDGFSGGVFFGIAVCVAVWITVKLIGALDRERHVALERRL